MYTTLQRGFRDGGVLGYWHTPHHSNGDAFGQQAPGRKPVLGAVLGVGGWEKIWVES